MFRLFSLVLPQPYSMSYTASFSISLHRDQTSYLTLPIKIDFSKFWDLVRTQVNTNSDAHARKCDKVIAEDTDTLGTLWFP